MKVSIITVVYNNALTIGDALDSVSNQDYSNIEYIVIDGGSKDGTVELIQHAKSVTKWISEPDKGLYDAMNKGLKMATGDFVGILNSDDMYTSSHVISDVVDKVTQAHCDVLYADINYVDPQNPTRIVRKWKSHEFGSKYFENGYVPAHPTVFIKKKLVKDYTYNLKFKLAADYDWLLRLFGDPKVIIHYFPEAIINMRLGGVTSKGWVNILKGNIEITRSWWNNRRKLPIKTLLINRPMVKLRQFV